MKLGDIIARIKQSLYGEINSDYYEDLTNRIADKLTDLGLVKTGSITSIIRDIEKKTGRKILDREFLGVKQIEKDRLTRYKNFEYIYENIPQVYQAVGIYTDNILSPDITSKTIFHVVPDSRLPIDSEKIATLESEIQHDMKSIKLDEKAEPIVSNTLLYGDFFVEIIDTHKSLEQMNLKPLNESYLESENDVLEIKVDLKENSLDVKTYNISKVIQEESDTLTIEHILLKMHNPKFVVKLVVDDFCFGYLVIKPKGKQVDKNASELIGHRVISVLKRNAKVVSSLLDQNPALESELSKFIQSLRNNQITVRFVPEERMVHFRIPSAVYDPYGESIITPIQELAKYVIASEKALLIYRLTRAPEKRIFKIHIRKDTQEADEIIQEIMRETKQKEYIVSPVHQTLP